jgi:hypothetical protein
MAFDFKKEYKEFYLPPAKPEIIDVPPMKYIAVQGAGDPNIEGGEYQTAIGLLYGIAYTLKMSKMTNHRIDGYFDYVVPPLEGFWWFGENTGMDIKNKSDFKWLSVIRVPDFVTKADFDWAVAEAAKKKKQDFSKVEFLTIEEGLCVQAMHIGPFDEEPKTVELMNAFLSENGYAEDFSETRSHHEIYLSDPRKTEPAKWKTVIRHPVKKA